MTYTLALQITGDQLREYTALCACKHPNVVALLGLLLDKDRGFDAVHLVLEYIEKTLYDVISEAHSAGECSLGEERGARITKDIASALECCHELLIIHRDLKPQNVLVDTRLGQRAVLCDFGMSCATIEVLDRPLTAQTCTRWYRAPEILLESRKYDTSVDMWALGCTLFEMMHLRPLFRQKTEIGMLQHIFAAVGAPGEDAFPMLQFLPSSEAKVGGAGSVDAKIEECGALRDIIRSMLKVRPAERPSAKKVVCDLTEIIRAFSPETVSVALVLPASATHGVDAVVSQKRLHTPCSTAVEAPPLEKRLCTRPSVALRTCPPVEP